MKQKNVFSPIHCKFVKKIRVSQEISIGKAIREFLKKSKLKGGIQALQIEEIWGEIMGKTIAKYTDKIEVVNNTLFISTTVAPLRNELLYQKEMVMKRVNEALGEKIIKEVVIR
jgi:Dna[CI] antecedent, DciA